VKLKPLTANAIKQRKKKHSQINGNGERAHHREQERLEIYPDHVDNDADWFYEPMNHGEEESGSDDDDYHENDGDSDWEDVDGDIGTFIHDRRVHTYISNI
jgi:hypothetical protein